MADNSGIGGGCGIPRDLVALGINNDNRGLGSSAIRAGEERTTHLVPPWIASRTRPFADASCSRAASGVMSSKVLTMAVLTSPARFNAARASSSLMPVAPRAIDRQRVVEGEGGAW